MGVIVVLPRGYNFKISRGSSCPGLGKALVLWWGRKSIRAFTDREGVMGALIRP